MKAKVGDKVVNVIPDDGRFLDLSDMTYYDAADLSFDFDDDCWGAFRREAAKDILCSVISGGIAAGGRGFVNERQSLVASSIEVADELIKQLKEGEK